MFRDAQTVTVVDGLERQRRALQQRVRVERNKMAAFKAVGRPTVKVKAFAASRVSPEECANDNVIVASVVVIPSAGAFIILAW